MQRILSFYKTKIDPWKGLTIVLVGTFMMVQQLAAQTDPHFTQNYTYPLYINPAMAGQGGGDYRVSAIYRSQWSAMGSPYRTTGLSADAATDNNLALGINILNQSAGEVGYNYFNAYASIAYTGVKFGKKDNHHLVFAMQAGVLNRHVDQSRFKWDEQWNPITGYSAAHLSSESLPKTSATSLDMGTGVLYYDASGNRRLNFFGGISVYHINKPSDPIFTEGTQLNTIPMRYSFHGGVGINLADGASIVPHVLYNLQGNAREVTIGVHGEKKVNEETTVTAGCYYRLKDAVSPCVGIDFRNFLVGISYDINVLNAGAMTRNMNSFELSFSYIMKKKNRIDADLVHPRL